MVKAMGIMIAIWEEKQTGKGYEELDRKFF